MPDYQKNENFKIFLGDRLFNKYGDIDSLLRLIYYRLDTWPLGLFNCDGISFNFKAAEIEDKTKNSCFKYIVYFVRKCIFCIPYFYKLLINKKKSSKCLVVFSDTFLMLNRYEYIMNVLLTNYEIASIMTMNDVRLNKRRMAELDRKRYNSRCVFLGSSICGIMVKYYVCKLSDVMYEMYKSNKTLDDCYKKSEVLIYKLNKYVEKRINQICHELKKTKARTFITINQYNVSDWLCIKACERLGIKTKELSHSEQVMDPVNYFDIYGDGFDFVNETLYWHKETTLWIKKYALVFHYASNYRYDWVGNPELDYEVIEQSNRKIQRDIILFFVPDIRYFFTCNNFEITAPLKKFYSSIFEQLYALRERLGLDVYLKFHPGDTKIISEMVNEYIHKYNFKIIEDNKKKLVQMLLRTNISIGYRTSALVLAHDFGCKCYSIRYEEYQYDYCGIEIEDIDINEIHKCRGLSLNDGQTEVYKFDYDKLLKGYL